LLNELDFVLYMSTNLYSTIILLMDHNIKCIHSPNFMYHFIPLS